MGLFRRLFGKKKKEEEEIIVPMVEKINFERLKEATDELLTKFATDIINEEPLIINLEMLDTDGANKVIAFFSGVVYTLDGEVVQIQDKIYMFANKGVYEDGTIGEFLKELM